MTLKCLKEEFSVCQITNLSQVNFDSEYCFLCKTDEEISLLCINDDVPENCVNCEGGWNGFKISGSLDFSLVGILSRISSILAKAQISIFVVSTYNTDYVFAKSASFAKALAVLSENGYTIEK